MEEVSRVKTRGAFVSYGLMNQGSNLRYQIAFEAGQDINEKDFVLVVRAPDVSSLREVVSGWQYSSILQAPYCYLPVSSAGELVVVPEIRFVESVSQVLCEVLPWRNKSKQARPVRDVYQVIDVNGCPVMIKMES